MAKWLLLLVPMLLLDYYGFQVSKTLTNGRSWATTLYWGFHVMVYLSIMAFPLFHARQEIPVRYVYLFFSLILMLYIPKIAAGVILGIEDFFRGILQFTMIKKDGLAVPADTARIPRSKFISQLALGIAALPFTGMAYAIVKGKYNFHVRKVSLTLENLPKAFEGLTITQVSDFHIGSFNSHDAVQKGIDLVNQQKSDLIFFTGDLVNKVAAEVRGFEPILSQLKARLGVYSVLGNHDYGDYASEIQTDADWEAHFQDMLATHESLGWRLLRNEHEIIREGADSLAVIGVENWGRFNSHTNYGNLKQACEGTAYAPVKLLLSHDPSHWEEEVLSGSDVDVTFSGHTHGCQFGIEIPGIKWSPVQYVYRQWAGLYQEGNRYLYVNRGFGFAGFSGRLGIPPEITVFELKRG
ncbi:MAG: metallophosphoesterase [Bacteroidota bacterium]